MACVSALNVRYFNGRAVRYRQYLRSYDAQPTQASMQMSDLLTSRVVAADMTATLARAVS